MSRGSIVLPQVGKLFHKRVNSKNKVHFKVCRGYLETEKVSDILEIIDKVYDMPEFDYVVLIGVVNRIKIKNGKAVYRQRLYFESIVGVKKLCTYFDLSCRIGDTFNLGINDVVNCSGELQFFERCARKLGYSIDFWISLCCIMSITDFLEGSNVVVENGVKYDSGFVSGAPVLFKTKLVEKRGKRI